MTAVRGGQAGDDSLDPALVRLAVVVLTGAIASLLDTTIVSVALAALSRDLHAPVADVQWVSTGYLLALSVVIPLTGWAADRFGARRMWLVTLLLFGAGSAACGAAWSLSALIAFRVLQGLGGGMMLPLAQSIIAQAAGPARFGRAMSLVAVPAQLAPVIGPVAGGLIVTGLGWRWIFYVNVPVCAVAMAAAWRGMPAGSPPGRRRLDLPGLLLLSPGLAGVVYGLSEAGQRGGFRDGDVLVPLCAGAALIAGFAVRALRPGPGEPLLDLGLLRARPVAVASALMFLFGISLYGAMLLMPLYYQQVRGQSALSAGLLLAPQGLGTMLALTVVGRLTDTTGPRRIVLAGMTVAVAGTIPFALTGPGTSQLLLAAAGLVRGAGLGAATIPVMATAYRGLRKDQIPRATAMINVLQRVGASAGTAVLAVILQREETTRRAAGPGTAALAGAFGTAFWWATAFTVLLLGPALLLPSRPAGRPGSPDDVPQPAARNPPA